MFKSYLKIAFRNISRNKSYSLLNIVGLAIGMAACIAISFFVRNEMSYDQHHKDADRIYRVALDIRSATDNRVFAQTSAPLAAALKKDFPQVEAAVRLWRFDNLLVQSNEQTKFYEDRFYAVDQEIFNVFTLPLAKGDARTALSKPATIVLSESEAKKYFADAEAIGKTLKIDDRNYEVTGILKDLPYNSHLKINMLTSFATFESASWYKENSIGDNWFSTMFYTYIKVKDNTDIPSFSKNIANAANNYIADRSDIKTVFHYFLQPIGDIHLHSHLRDETEPPGSATNVSIFSVVALLIIVIAALNYINLTTAQSAKRAKEVGVRKVVGASKIPLVLQFLFESLLLTFIALAFAFLIIILIRPLFETISGYQYNFALLFTPSFFVTVIGMTFLLGVVAAIYPAMILSSFQPVTVLKGKFISGTKGIALRKALVVCQFGISLILIVGTIIVYRQLNFMKDQHLGFEKEQMLVLPLKGNTSIEDNYEIVKKEFSGHPAIKSATTSSDVPGSGVLNFGVSLIGEPDNKGQNMNYLFTDFDFLQTYGIGVVAGRSFDKQLKSNAESSFMINEKALKAFGWRNAEEAIGKKLNAGFGREGEIVGVFKDFHYKSLQMPIEPLVMAIVPWRLKNITLRVDTKDLNATMSFVQKKWAELFPQNPYEYYFIDEAFNRQYSADEKTGRTFLAFTCVAIFIACLGLFGLAAFVAQQRRKEIGVRKVLGASVPGIVNLLSRDFVKLVLVAFVIATPVSYFLISKWLESFATRINMGWVNFALAGLGLLAIAILTVSYQSIKAATANPVKSLRTE